MFCTRPVMNVFDGDMVRSCLHVCIPEEMLELVKRFEIGEIVKVEVSLGYSRENCSVTLTAAAIELVSKVKVLVI